MASSSVITGLSQCKEKHWPPESQRTARRPASRTRVHFCEARRRNTFRNESAMGCKLTTSLKDKVMSRAASSDWPLFKIRLHTCTNWWTQNWPLKVWSTHISLPLQKWIKYGLQRWIVIRLHTRIPLRRVTNAWPSRNWILTMQVTSRQAAEPRQRSALVPRFQSQRLPKWDTLKSQSSSTEKNRTFNHCTPQVASHLGGTSVILRYGTRSPYIFCYKMVKSEDIPNVEGWRYARQWLWLVIAWAL